MVKSNLNVSHKEPFQNVSGLVELAYQLFLHLLDTGQNWEKEKKQETYKEKIAF